MMKMRKIINKQVHQVVIKNHPAIMKNEIRKSMKFYFLSFNKNPNFSRSRSNSSSSDNHRNGSDRHRSSDDKKS
jgi:hypothetical protein